MIRFFQGIKEIKNFREDYEDFKNKITASVETTRALYYRDGLRVGEQIAKEIKDSVKLDIKKFKEEFDDNKLIAASINSKERFHALSMRLDDLEKAFGKLEEHIGLWDHTQLQSKSTLPIKEAKPLKKQKPLKLQAVEEEVKKVKSTLTQREVKRLFTYRDGELYWKVDQGNKSKKGDKAHFYLNAAGYYYLYIPSKQKLYNVSRLIFLMFHGYLPEYVSYIDNNSQNTRIENLRTATCSQVKCSAKRPKNNSSGYKGVYLHKKKGKYIAQIKKNKKHYYLGLFKTPEEAYKAYCKAAKKLHGEFARVA